MFPSSPTYAAAVSPDVLQWISFLAILTINRIVLTSVLIPNPTIKPAKAITAIKGAISAKAGFGIVLKSNGNMESNVATVAIPNKSKTIKVIWRTKYLSKIIKTIWPIIDKTRVMVRIGNHKSKSPVRNGYLTHLVTPYTVSGL